MPKTFAPRFTRRRETRVGDGNSKHYACVATRGAFTAFAHGSEVHLRTTLTYTARGFYKAAHRADARRQLRRGRRTSADRRRTRGPARADARTGTCDQGARIASLAPASTSDRDKVPASASCPLTSPGRCSTRPAKGIDGHLGDIDAKVGKVNLTDQATGWWAHLNEPIRLAEGVWLLLQPQQLRLKGVRGERAPAQRGRRASTRSRSS